MDIQTPDQTLPSSDDFTSILEATLENTIPANQCTTPEHRAQILFDARREFAAFNPLDAADARLAAFAIADMLGAVDSVERAAKPGVGGETVGRLRGNARAAARFYKSTLKEMRKRRQPDVEPLPKTRAAASRKSDPPPEEFEPIPHIEQFQPRDRRGKPIPRWRNELLTRKQKLAAYAYQDKPAWDVAREEEDAAIAEQAKIDAQGGTTEPEIDGFLPLRKNKPLPTAATDPPKTK
jgi:hypothetical protein